MKSQSLFDSDAIAREWADKICSRLGEMGVSADEIEETRLIIKAFTRTAAKELSDDRTITLPYSPEPMTIDASIAHQILDLFLRGVNQVAKKLRNSGRDWDERKVLLEKAAWKIFNLSKLLVGFLYIPNPAMQGMLKNTKDLQLMMKQTADSLLDEVLNDR